MDDEELVRRFECGELVSSIAKSCGKAKATIANRLSRLRKDGRVGRRRDRVDHPRFDLAAARKQLVMKLRQSGMSGKMIAMKLDLSEQYVYQLLATYAPKNYESELSRLNAELAAIGEQSNEGKVG